MIDILPLLSKFIDADKLGGWVRAGVGALIAAVIAKWPGLSSILDPSTQAAIGVAVSGIVVGIWSQLVKSDAAKVQMAAAVPAVKQITVTDPAIAAVPAPEVVMAK